MLQENLIIPSPQPPSFHLAVADMREFLGTAVEIRLLACPAS
jgi:hypothetical protein